MGTPEQKEAGMRTVQRTAEAGFTLIELLILVLLVGILSAVAVPIYLGYTKVAKTAEGKALVGAVWTAWQATAQLKCGVAQTIKVTYPKVNLSATGATTPARWDVSTTDAETLTLNCTTGVYTLSAPVVTKGTTVDINTLQIKLAYNPATIPPVLLTCSTDGGTTFTPC